MSVDMWKVIFIIAIYLICSNARIANRNCHCGIFKANNAGLRVGRPLAYDRMQNLSVNCNYMDNGEYVSDRSIRCARACMDYVNTYSDRNHYATDICYTLGHVMYVQLRIYFRMCRSVWRETPMVSTSNFCCMDNLPINCQYRTLVPTMGITWNRMTPDWGRGQVIPAVEEAISNDYAIHMPIVRAPYGHKLIMP